MRRSLAGTALILHGAAHTLAGMRATDPSQWSSVAALPLWIANVAWLAAATGFVAAGAGLLGARPFRAVWRIAAWSGIAGSAILLLGFWRTMLGGAGLLIDVVIVALLARRTAPQAAPHARRTFLSHAGSVAAVAAVAGLAALLLARPWHQRWGSRPDEIARPLPGDADQLAAGMAPSYQIQHAVTVAAPPDAVWPWLAQFGQDRGGFYSHAWLENLFGLRIVNADRIHPEWQRIEAGDTVFATPEGWLGLRRRLGWHVVRAEPGRVLVLENWGAFILEPDPDGTRLIIRSLGGGPDTFAGVVLAPLGMILFEPAHFIMQRHMLRSIRRRVEADGPAG